MFRRNEGREMSGSLTNGSPFPGVLLKNCLMTVLLLA
jgi:hypothetical protein